MLKKGIKRLVDEAEAEIETIDIEAAKHLVDDEDTVIVDLRDIRELWNVGTIPGSVHAPRGMLEFWVDPESPYHRDVFSSGKKLVFFCAAGWRSALATKALKPLPHTTTVSPPSALPPRSRKITSLVTAVATIGWVARLVTELVSGL